MFASNDNWSESGAAPARAAFATAGAFDLPDAASKDAALLDEILRKLERDRRAKERAATPANTSGETSKGIANAKDKAKEKKPKPAQPDPGDRGPS